MCPKDDQRPHSGFFGCRKIPETDRSNLNSCRDWNEIFSQVWFVGKVAADAGLNLGTMAQQGIHFWKLGFWTAFFKNAYWMCKFFQTYSPRWNGFYIVMSCAYTCIGENFCAKKQTHGYIGTQEPCFHPQIILKSTALVTKPGWKKTKSICVRVKKLFIWKVLVQSGCVGQSSVRKFPHTLNFFVVKDFFWLGLLQLYNRFAFNRVSESLDSSQYDTKQTTVYAKSLPHPVPIQRQLSSFHCFALLQWSLPELLFFSLTITFSVSRCKKNTYEEKNTNILNKDYITKKLSKMNICIEYTHSYSVLLPCNNSSLVMLGQGIDHQQSEKIAPDRNDGRRLKWMERRIINEHRISKHQNVWRNNTFFPMEKSDISCPITQWNCTTLYNNVVYGACLYSTQILGQSPGYKFQQNFLIFYKYFWNLTCLKSFFEKKNRIISKIQLNHLNYFFLFKI